MASLAHFILQDENAPAIRGKGVDGGNVELLKHKRSAQSDRKALRDLSNATKPPLSAIAKGSILKEKYAVPKHAASKTAKKTNFLTDEEIKKCHEWAKEGIEQVHSTGNDIQKFHRDENENRVTKKVGKALSAIRDWTDVPYDLRTPLKESVPAKTNVHNMELEPVFSPPLRSTEEENKTHDLLFEPWCEDIMFMGATVQLKLKDNMISEVGTC